MDISVKLGMLKLKNPIMTASGTFGYGLEFKPYGRLEDLGAVVVKGLSLEPRQGNPMPRIVETPCGMLNAIGLQNIGVEAFLKEKLGLLPWKTTPVIVNLYGQTREDFARLADILSREQGVAALEVNISCPNVREGGIQFGQDPVQAARVTEVVKKSAGSKPVIIKLSPNVSDVTVIARAVESAGADAISLINTLGGMAVDIYTRKPCLANKFGGLSGPAIKPVALKMVHEVCKKVSLPVIGLGGISSARDVLEFILVGASAVQVGTATFTRPDRVFSLVSEVEKLAMELGLDSWNDFQGTLKN
ncbi:dihydroorotate dehydrogenase [Desulfonatronovibrio hydrogenovorans]|uniref:dihydroorotate dehydrogenase n=1 Tax=Desulfonatronovibrio hydrogenovorans TaxID=53245 RepID=UPI00048B7988|nr:dihydroorotate dehydrogenase [Desulfonatronovibrio hydrogenovorans]